MFTFAHGFLRSVEEAASDSIIVDTDAGSTRDYATLAAAITGEAGTLSSPLVIECRATTGVADTAQVDVTGITTSATNTLTIEAAATAGYWDTGNYRLIVNSSGADSLQISTDNVILDGLQIEQENEGSTYGALYAGTTEDNIIVKNCILVGLLASVAETRSTNTQFISCISIVDHATSAASCFYGATVTDTEYLNCTTACLNTTSGKGFNHSGAVAKNCYSYALNSFVVGTTTTCASSDGNQDYTVTLAQGFSSADPIANRDFRLNSTSDLRSNGTDLSGTFTTDITGYTRSDWDIGAFEFDGQ